MLSKDVLIILVCCVAVAVLAVVIFTKRAKRKRRIAALKVQAEQLGLKVVDDLDGRVLSQFKNFKLFSHGNKRGIVNLIAVDDEDAKILIFDYRFATNPTGKVATKHAQTVVAIQSQNLHCPEILMRPETFADRIDRKLGYQDGGHDLGSEFSKMFILNGPNEAAIRSFFTPAALEFFERHPGISLEALDNTIFYYRPRKLRKPDELELLLAQAREAFGVLKNANA